MLVAGCSILDTRSCKLDAGWGLLDRWLLAVGICLHIAGFGWLSPGPAILFIYCETDGCGTLPSGHVGTGFFGLFRVPRNARLLKSSDSVD